MSIRKILGLTLGKLIFKVITILKIGGGSAAPGLYALKIYPQLVADLATQIPQTVVITGTNGKTTTSRMLAHFATQSGLKVIRNSTGSNLERGIASTLISCSHLLSGKLKKFDLAIWELDEAAFNQVVPKLKPQIIVCLNVFRDQLDRYGEVDSIVKKWSSTLKNISPGTALFLNGDDQNLLSLKKSFQGLIFTFGVENYKIRGEEHFKKIGEEKLDLEAQNVTLLGLDGVKFELNENDGVWNFLLPLPGIYHIYDFLAAYTVSSRLGVEKKAVIQALKNFSPAFGRVEKFVLTPSRCKHEIEGYILLIKNPTGASEVFETLKGELKPQDRLLIALNDNLADGTDVSWIWDANFELLSSSSRAKSGDLKNEIASSQAHRNNIIVSGSRASDLVVRLKYAGFNPESIQVENNLKKAFKQATDGLQGRLFILPTYTALLELQRILADQGIKKHYWKEDN